MPDADRPGGHAQPWTAHTYVVVDVEGNGQHPPDLVEVAVVPITAGTLGAVKPWLIRPPRPVTWQARRVHGLTDTDLATAPTIDDLRDDLTAHLRAGIVVGHNVGVDLAVLTRALPGWQPEMVVDTLRLARKWLPDLASHCLAALIDHFGLAALLPTGGPHRAAYDALAAAHLLVRLADHRPHSCTLDDLLNPAPATETTTMAFDDPSGPRLF